jgi:hypothetical protein
LRLSYYRLAIWFYNEMEGPLWLFENKLLSESPIIAARPLTVTPAVA